MIDLYHCARSRSFRPLWMLEELQLSYRLHVLPFPPRVKAREYLGLNPLGTVPCFIDGDVIMTESSAICQYLADRDETHSFSVPPSDPTYARYLNFLSFGEATLTFPIAIYMRYTRLEPEETRAPRVANDYRRFFFGRLRAISAILSKGDYVCGARFTAADISVGYALIFAAMNGLEDDFPPEVFAYLERLRARDAFRRALIAESAPNRQDGGQA